MKLKDTRKENHDQPRQHIKEQRHYFANKGPSSQGYGFSSGHVWMWELDCEESWAPKNWCFWTVVLEKTLETPLHCKEIQSVLPKGDQSWVFIGSWWCWSWSSNTLATWCKELTHWKRPWCWEGFGGGRRRGQQRMRWLDGITYRWTRFWVNSGSLWCTGRPGVLWFVGLQRVGHDREAELNWWGYLEKSAVEGCEQESTR